MKGLILTLCALLCTWGAVAQNQFGPDPLGPDFEKITIELADDFDGPVVTTVVRLKPTKWVHPTRAVLYVHGYNDYFFQREMAEKFFDHDWQFYAVDLRRYGRSMREWQSPFSLRSVDDYFEDIDAAIELMHQQGIEEIILMGHSTGGLTTSLYCHHNRDNLQISALILNSPFFDMNLGGWFMEDLCVPVISSLGGVFKNWRVSGGSDTPGGYGRSISDKFDGEWPFDTTFKRVESLPITAMWLRAIHKGHRKLQTGLDIPCPVLVMYSDKTIGEEYSPELYKSGDAVLDVADIKKYAPGLGTNVTQVEVAGGMHDLVLSTPQVRYPLYRLIFEWIDGLATE
ncbi:MAG: alpha/beta hydrolase [Rikenellaceae bacterium]